MHKMKKQSGLLCCVAALLFVISCSSHRSTADSRNHSNVYLRHSTPVAFTSDHGSEVVVVQAIVIAAILVLPPIIDAVGEFLDDVFVDIGLKERETFSPRYLSAPANHN